MTAVLPDRAVRDVEVATVEADRLRVSVRVTGTVDADAMALLQSVLDTHVGAGRLYLRVDLVAATVDASALGRLVRSHAAIRELGGMLVFDHAGPALVDAIRAAQLFAATPAGGS